MTSSDGSGAWRGRDMERGVELTPSNADSGRPTTRAREWVCIRCGVAIESETCPLCKSDQHSVRLPSLAAERFVHVTSEEQLRSAGNLHRRQPPPSRGFRPDDL